MQSQSLISVILPAANAEQFIEASVHSVLHQSYRHLELIIVNDGSTDSTSELIDQLAARDARIRVRHLNSRSGGPAKPRNIGLLQAKGEWSAFIDADDIWHPQKVERQIEYAQARQLNFISSDCHRFTHASSLNEYECWSSEANFTELNHGMMLRKNRVVTSSMMVQTSLIKEIGFSEHSDYIGVEDYLAWLHLTQNSTIRGGVLHLPLVYYRLRPDSLSASKLAMASKIHTLLKHYRVDGRSLGWRRYWFFASYVFIALMNRLRY